MRRVVCSKIWAFKPLPKMTGGGDKRIVIMYSATLWTYEISQNINVQLLLSSLGMFICMEAGKRCLIYTWIQSPQKLSRVGFFFMIKWTAKQLFTPLFFRGLNLSDPTLNYLKERSRVRNQFYHPQNITFASPSVDENDIVNMTSDSNSCKASYLSVM